MKKYTVLLLVLFCLSCSKKLSIGKSEDYDLFYDRFHTDLEFQLSRVQFPLDGVYTDVEGTVKWDKSNWVFQEVKISEINQPDYDTEEVREDDLVIERVNLHGAGYESERRFKRIKGKWFLVYYDTTNL